MTPGHIAVHGDADAGGSDSVAWDAAGAVTAAMDRRAELASDTYGQGSVIGDLMDLPVRASRRTARSSRGQRDSPPCLTRQGYVAASPYPANV
jgi:hypothetical protein